MVQFKQFSPGLLGSLFLALFVMVQSDDSCNLDFEKTLTTIFAPQEQPSIQIRTLRRYMLRLLQSMVAKAEEVEGWNTYVYPKRNLEALARAGYLQTLPEDEDNQTDIQEKRSLATLVKNGQLPTHESHDDEENKRSIESMARSGEIQRILDEIHGKMPILQDYVTKRNLASITRDGGFGGKRNAAALLRNDRYLNNQVQSSFKPKYRRNIGDYDNDDSFISPDEYQNLIQEIMEGQKTQKRFLGSIANSGWYNSPWRSSFARNDDEMSVPGKRHIGTLARLGWLPTTRSIRRFSRSGRTNEDGPCRETSSNGQDQDYYFSENSIPVDNKRFLRVPAMWKVPLQTVNY